jgi:hypothetical protein
LNSIDLASLPVRYLRKGTTVYRSHSVSASPLTTAQHQRGPFDLAAPRITAYLATEAGAAITELLGPIAGRARAVTEEQARRFVVTSMVIRRPFKLASVDHAKARKAGLDLPKHKGLPAFAVTRTLAARLDAAGFDGVFYSSPFVDHERVTLIALFDAPANAKPVLEVTSGRMPGIHAALEAGFTVVTAHTRAHLDLI